MSSVENTVTQFIKTLSSKPRIVEGMKNQRRGLLLTVMVSGGVDSMVLLHVLNKLKNELSLSLIVVYTDFKDFPEHKETRELIVRKVTDYVLPLVIHRVLDYTPSKTNARAKLSEAGRSVISDAVLTAHHADDQIETFLFRSFRGAGADGLACMTPFTKHANVNYGKPLLSLFKEELLDYAKVFNVEYLPDTSNSDNNHDRNYIRNKVIPVIKDRFDYKLILDTISNIQEQKETVKEIMTNYIEKRYRQTYKEGSGEWDITYFMGLTVLERLGWVKHHVSQTYGHQMSKKTITNLKTSLSGDLTVLAVDISPSIRVCRKGSYIVVEGGLNKY